MGSLSLLQSSSQPRDPTQVSRIAGGFFTYENKNPKSTQESEAGMKIRENNPQTVCEHCAPSPYASRNQLAKETRGSSFSLLCPFSL